MKAFASKRFGSDAGGGVLRELATSALEKRLVDEVLAARTGMDGEDIVPAFYASVADIAPIPSAPCPLSMARLLKQYGDPDKRFVVIGRTCDLRAVVELCKRNQLNADNLYLIGVDCVNLEEPHSAACGRCEFRMPFMADVVCCLNGGATGIEARTEKGRALVEASENLVPLDDEIERDAERVAELARKQQKEEFDELDSMSPAERLHYWLHQFEKCIKCYGCRNSCPICYCTDCYLGPRRPLVRRGELPPEGTFHLARLAHVADSCVNCGRCEEACPMNIPISRLYHMLHQRLVKALKYEAGMDFDTPPPLGAIPAEKLTEGEGEDG